MAGATSSCLRRTEPPHDEKLQISKISDFLYLAGCTGLTVDRLNRLNFTCAINCIKGIKHHFPPSVEYLYVPVEDDESEDLTKYIPKVSGLIEKHRKMDGKTLVYCGLGISRSASFVIAYYMQHSQLNLREAYKLVQTNRNIICPNVGFFRQLLEIEQKLYGQTTIKIIEPAPGVKVPDVVWEEVYEEVMQKLNNQL